MEIEFTKGMITFLVGISGIALSLILMLVYLITTGRSKRRLKEKLNNIYEE